MSAPTSTDRELWRQFAANTRTALNLEALERRLEQRRKVERDTADRREADHDER